MGIVRKAAIADAASSNAAGAVRHAMVEAGNIIMKLTFIEGDVVWRQTRQGRTGARVHSARHFRPPRGGQGNGRLAQEGVGVEDQ